MQVFQFYEMYVIINYELEEYQPSRLGNKCIIFAREHYLQKNCIRNLTLRENTGILAAQNSCFHGYWACSVSRRSSSAIWD